MMGPEDMSGGTYHAPEEHNPTWTDFDSAVGKIDAHKNLSDAERQALHDAGQDDALSANEFPWMEDATSAHYDPNLDPYREGGAVEDDGRDEEDNLKYPVDK